MLTVAFIEARAVEHLHRIERQSAKKCQYDEMKKSVIKSDS
jgi:hypothetical protein